MYLVLHYFRLVYNPDFCHNFMTVVTQTTFDWFVKYKGTIIYVYTPKVQGKKIRNCVSDMIICFLVAWWHIVNFETVFSMTYLIVTMSLKRCVNSRFH